MFWWVAPSLAFYLLIHIRQAGHTFTFMPALVLAAGFALVRVFQAFTKPAWRWGSALAAVVVLFNIAFFFLAPPFLFGRKTQVLNAPSWPAIHTRNVVVGEKLAYIRANFPSQDTAVFATQFDFRLPDYYLRSYRVPSLSYQTPGDSGQIALGGDVKVLVLFNDETVVDDGSLGAVQESKLGSGETLRWLGRAESQVFVITDGTVGIRDRKPGDP